MGAAFVECKGEVGVQNRFEVDAASAFAGAGGHQNQVAKVHTQADIFLSGCAIFSRNRAGRCAYSVAKEVANRGPWSRHSPCSKKLTIARENRETNILLSILLQCTNRNRNI